MRQGCCPFLSMSQGCYPFLSMSQGCCPFLSMSQGCCPLLFGLVVRVQRRQLKTDGRCNCFQCCVMVAVIVVRAA